LRSRFLSPETGRFQTKDNWQGDYNKPASLNRWGYVEGNPINHADPTGQYAEEDFGIYFSETTGAWSEVDKQAVLFAVSIVGQKFSSSLPTSAFRDVYGITSSRLMQFEWDVKCAGCRPYYCNASQNAKNKEYWENLIVIENGTVKKDKKTGRDLYTQIPLLGGGSADCMCKPSGGFTNTSRWIEFASVSSNNDRKVNNVIHELGHAFSNGRLGKIPNNAVKSYTAYINGKLWSINSRPDGFYKNGGVEARTWQQSTQVTDSEIFADMFLGWVQNKWEDDDYGKARDKFMNDNMPIWIQQAKSID